MTGRWGTKMVAGAWCCGEEEGHARNGWCENYLKFRGL